ncbi:hypothetical protein NPIL_59291 [Nephila pilipes]|uniref:Uncharacterized protein n=1 Tax=Nephila pilipes TaxID=299642 RepID=A0A8X6QY63_NEPPI|nr:hypothetical protein NPIL_59291 [Nephila pilipes]
MFELCSFPPIQPILPFFLGGSPLAPFIPLRPPPPPHQDFRTPSPPNSPNLNHHRNQQQRHTAKDGGVYRSGRYCSYSCVVTEMEMKYVSTDRFLGPMHRLQTV